jgi:hypothetical protein
VTFVLRAPCLELQQPGLVLHLAQLRFPAAQRISGEPQRLRARLEPRGQDRLGGDRAQRRQRLAELESDVAAALRDGGQRGEIAGRGSKPSAS